MYTLLHPSKSHLWMRRFLESGDSDRLWRLVLSMLNGEMEQANFWLVIRFPRTLDTGDGCTSCTALAMERAVDPVSLTLSKVTFGRSSSSLSLLLCLGDRPRGSICALPWLLPSSRSGTTTVLFTFPGDRTAV